MARLKLSLLGAFEASLDGKPLSGIKTDKGRALLIYLGVERGRAHRRQALAGLLWPDYPESAARENLRHALSNLRQVLGEEQNKVPFLLVEGETLQLNPESDCWLDVAEFERLAAGTANSDLESAIALYRGGFLEGFTLKDSPDFDSWTAILREHYLQTVSKVLGKVGEQAAQNEAYEKAIAYARRRLALEPWQEEAHRQIMRFLALNVQRAAALAQYEACCKILKDELGVEPSVETLRLQASIRDGEITGTKQAKIRKDNLPAQVTSFIGREKEIEQVKNLLRASRLVTLTGSGGTGKTRLSLHVAAVLVEQFPDGVWLVELAAFSDPQLVIQTVGRALGMRLEAGTQALAMLEDYLEAKHLLLILDNCEHLVEACARLGDALLKACPHLHILASSREALGIAGEIPYRVPPLSLPGVHDLPPVQELEKYEAVRLFVERADTASPDFHLTPENASAVAQICQQLDGIPLAIELAAARVKVLRVEEIALRLDDRLRLLTGGSRAALPRYQTLRASIDWSYDLLSLAERSLLQRLSVFAGGWVLEAAEYVGCGEGIETCDVLDLLSQLVNKSLVVVEAEAGFETRYRMLETIRQYAHEKLVESGEGEVVRDRHLEYYVVLAERFEGRIRGPEMMAIMERLEAEMDNFRLAFERCVILPGSSSQKEIASWLTEQGLRLGAALHWFWHIQRHLDEGLHWLKQLLDNDAALRNTPGGLGEIIEPKKIMIRAKALYVVCFFADDYRVMERLWESRELYARLGEQGKLGYACVGVQLGERFRDDHGDYLQAEKYFLESLAIFREVGEKFRASEAISGLATNAFHQGAMERATAYYEESLALYREIGDQEGVAYILYCLGDVMSYGLSASDPLLDEQVRALYEESREILRRFKSRGINFPLNALGSLYWRQGKYAEAADCFNEALDAAQKHADSGAKIDSLAWLGDLALSQGEYATAAKFFDQRAALNQKQGTNVHSPYTQFYLGIMAQLTGKLDRASQIYTDALESARENGILDLEVMALLYIGKVYLEQGECVSAKNYMQKALEKRHGKQPYFIWGNIEAIALLAACPQARAPRPKLERAAWLLGTTEAWHVKWQHTRTPRERRERESTIAHVRQALGEPAFTKAWEEGKAMTLEQAIAYAREEGNG